MTCKDCFKFDVCSLVIECDDDVDSCPYFKAHSRFVETPCGIGDTVFYISGGKIYKSKCHAITLKPYLQIHLYDYDGDNAAYSTKEVFPTRAEAKRALECSEI